ncbi:lantibiotic dehydratase [Chitinophaga sp. 212800010-3]|uniref:lantibiotic dehydratase n=1 Tax=unclassified Chitinophaga TaxID=2619133 RepID=UPI002DF69D99|nr:Thiopeptide-type bacteriocin biosynthesis domain-containing protein [Chitinophaga sp. 212800010-3]
MSSLIVGDFFLLRMPLLPFGEIVQLHESAGNDQYAFIQTLRKLFSNPLLQEAVFLASPALYQEMLKWLEQPDDRLKLPLSLYRYLLRMSARSTPYGLFAGCTIGATGQSHTSLMPPANDSLRKTARLDMEYLTGLIDGLLQHKDIYNTTLFYPNNSLYSAGGSWRYFEYQLQDGKRRYYLSAVAGNEYLSAVLAAARNGADIILLSTTLVEMGIPADEATAYIHSLVENQVLVAGLTPEITGRDNLQELIAQLARQAPETPVLPALQQIGRLLEQQTNGVDRYLEILQLLSDHFPGISAKDPVQVDLFFPPEVSALSAQVTNTLAEQLERLSVLAVNATHRDLQAFRDKFTEQYDQREIPLMQALDSESGIGYGVASGDNASYTPLIDDLLMPARKQNGTTNWNGYMKFVFRHFLAAQKTGAREIVLTDEALAELATVAAPPALPASLSLMGTLIATDAPAADNGTFTFLLRACNGPNAMALPARFAVGDEQLESALKAFAREDQQLEEDRIIAEIVHLPEGRTGNILLRPTLYDYEIPFLGSSSVAPEFRLPVSDLYVAVRNNRVVLRSARLNKEILPRLSSAHNYAHGLAVYKFLCDLQQQDACSVLWNWGFLREQPFLPRVTYRNIVLERARWQLNSHAFNQLLPGRTPDEALLLLQQQYDIPAQVLLSEGDNDLFIDMNNVFARGIVADKLKKYDVLLHEQLYDVNSRLAANNAGSWCNEVIIPFRNRNWKPLPVANRRVVTEQQRNFPPGSEWLYMKIYTGIKWVDKLLIRELAPLAKRLRHTGLADKWFFIRYQDPDHHLRIRFHMPDHQKNSGTVMQELKQALLPYLEDGVVQKIQFDTYIRELERYGSEFMTHSETFFFQDSEAVAELLSAISGAEIRERWLLALKGADDLLNVFGYTAAMKLQLLRHLQQQFFAEYEGDASLQLQLNNKYRAQSRLIDAVLGNNDNAYTFSEKVQEVLANRLAAGRHIASELPQAVAGELAPHYLHMFLNRMFSANARLQELVIYHYLMKYYTSAEARSRT